jgi:lipopolysaccharide export system ATP-binding protein
MAQGELLISGSPEEIANDERAKKIYLGEGFKLD